MRKVKALEIEWRYMNAPESPERLQSAYDRLFGLAWQRLLKKYEQRHISLWITIKD